MEREFIPVNIAVLTVSDTRTIENDTSGGYIADRLAEVGHQIVARAIVKDTETGIRAQLAAWIADPNVEVVIATGGTGVTPRDVTPEAMAPLITKHIPGFGELFRQLSFAEIGTATIQSRADAALCGQTYVFLLPGSTNGVKLGVEKILIPQLDHRLKPCNFVMLLPRIKNERAT
jgi:molybdenum cofactor biosynthesis protein B